MSNEPFSNLWEQTKEKKSECPLVSYHDEGDPETLIHIREILKTLYDPEFPLVDMETLGLFYAVKCDLETKKIVILMTFTTPACPMGDMIVEMVKNEVSKGFQERAIEVEITFEPLRSPQMIKDPDLQRMFE